MQLNIRKIVIGDIESILAVSNEPAFSIVHGLGFWSREQLAGWITSEEDTLLLAEDSEMGQIAGFVLTSFHKPTRKVLIENCWTTPDYRGRGVATLLLKKAEEILRSRGASVFIAEVKTDNIEVAKWFESLGYTKGYFMNWMVKE